MVISNGFRQTITISLFLHALFFTLFSFSFGKTIAPANSCAVSFWGQCLQNTQVYSGGPPPEAGTLIHPIALKTELSASVLEASALMIIENAAQEIRRQYLKPMYALKRIEAKETFAEPVVPVDIPPAADRAALTLYPVLPYSFILYFQDRQVAHVELMFKIVPAGLRNSVIVKRKISSGNLEADLVSMRYVSHYLFIQQEKITPNVWHTVRIDLTAREQ